MRGRWRVLQRAGGPPRRPRRSSLRAATALALLPACAAPLLAGCGGGSRQDAHEAAATYSMAVLRARFPARQVIARPTAMTMIVRNTGSTTVPNVAVTVDSFNYISTYPGLADSRRPIWAIERGPGVTPTPPVESVEVAKPGSGGTAYLNTWSLGSLAPHQSRLFVWHVVPLKPGVHVVHFRVAAGLAGKAKAERPRGGPVRGSFVVHVTKAPPPTHVNPNTGQVEPGPVPARP